MKAVLALLLGVAYSSHVWEQDVVDLKEVDLASAFEDWMVTFDKTYADPEEKAHRFLVFLATWEDVNYHNKYSGEPWTKGINQFSDLTKKEFIDQILVSDMPQDDPWGDDLPVMPWHQDDGAPTSVDWTNMNGTDYTTPIKNQGNCGSCWAFSTTGALEPRYAIKHGIASKVNIAEQELVDCDKGNSGCNGGWPSKAYQYVGKAGGLCLTSAYPYTARGGSCKASTCGAHKDPVQASQSSIAIQKDNAAALETATAAGPVSVAVDAGGWQSYKGGVFTAKCGTSLNHAVTDVGYGTMTGGDYWKVRNSWGASWGSQGYIYICRNCNKNGNQGQCGINHVPVVPNCT